MKMIWHQAECQYFRCRKYIFPSFLQEKIKISIIYEQVFISICMVIDVVIVVHAIKIRTNLAGLSGIFRTKTCQVCPAL